MVYTPPKITLKAARANAGLTLIEASKKIGVSVATLHSWEADSSDIKISSSKKDRRSLRLPNRIYFFWKHTRIKF